MFSSRFFITSKEFYARHFSSQTLTHSSFPRRRESSSAPKSVTCVQYDAKRERHPFHAFSTKMSFLFWKSVATFNAVLDSRLRGNDDGNVIMFSPLWSRPYCSYCSCSQTRHSTRNHSPTPTIRHSRLRALLSGIIFFLRNGWMFTVFHYVQRILCATFFLANTNPLVIPA